MLSNLSDVYNQDSLQYSIVAQIKMAHEDKQTVS